MPVDVQLPAKFALIFDHYRYKAFHGGRGSAKSWTIAQCLVVMGHQKKLRIFCGREIQRSIRDSVKKLLDDTIDRLGWRYNPKTGTGYYESTEYEIRHVRTGTVFIFGGLRANPEALRSLEGVDIVWIEEAHTMSAASFRILRPTVRKKGSELWFSWNRRFANDPVDKFFLDEEKGPPKRALVMQVNWRDNPWFTEELEEERLEDLDRDPDLYQHIWEGALLTHSAAAVFKRWEIKDFIAPEDAWFYYGSDWGFRNPTTVVRCFVRNRLRPDGKIKPAIYIDYEAYKTECEIDDLPELFEMVPGTRPETGHRPRITCDSADPQLTSYLRGQGFNCEDSIKGQNSKPQGVAFLKNYDIIVHPRCVHAIYELTNYSYEVDPHTEQVLNKLKDADNHIIDALRYAVEQARIGGGFFVFQDPDTGDEQQTEKE